MAGLGPKVTLTFAGDDSRLSRTLKSVEAKTSTLGGRLGSIGKGLSVFASGAASLQTIGGAVGAVAQLAPAALALPGVMLAGAAAMQTFKLATAGVGDAIAGDAEAFAKLAPNAQSAVTAVRAFAPAWEDVRKTVQNEFFQGLNTQIEQTGRVLLPILRAELPQIAGGFSLMARNALQAARSPFFQEDLAGILSNTGRSLSNMRDTVGNLMSGFVGLGGVGSTYLPALGTAVDGVAAKFKAWVDDGVQSGRINELIDGALQGFRDLGAIIGNVGSILGSVFSGLGGSTESFLAPLRDATAQLAAFMASASAQEALGALGEAMRAAGTLLREVLISALQALAPVISFLAPIVTSVASGLAAWAPVLGPIAVGLGGLVLAVQAITGAIALYNTVTTAVRAVTTAWTAVQWLLNAALTANPIGIVVVAIGALVAALIYAWNNSETFRSVVLSVWETVKSGISSAVAWIGSALAWFGSLPGRAAAWFGGMRDSAVGRMTALVDWVRGIPGRILSALGNLGSLLIGSGRALLEGLWNGVQNALGWVKSKISGALSSIRNLFPFSPAKEGPFSGSGYTTYSGLALAEDFAAGITAGAPKVHSASSALMSTASGAFSNLPDVVRQGSVDQATWNALRDAGWRGRAGDNMEAIYRPAGASGGSRSVTFHGNTADALAKVIQQMIRTGQIQIA